MGNLCITVISQPCTSSERDYASNVGRGKDYGERVTAVAWDELTLAGECLSEVSGKLHCVNSCLGMRLRWLKLEGLLRKCEEGHGHDWGRQRRLCLISVSLSDNAWCRKYTSSIDSRCRPSHSGIGYSCRLGALWRRENPEFRRAFPSPGSSKSGTCLRRRPAGGQGSKAAGRVIEGH